MCLQVVKQGMLTPTVLNIILNPNSRLCVILILIICKVSGLPTHKGIQLTEQPMGRLYPEVEVTKQMLKLDNSANVQMSAVHNSKKSGRDQTLQLGKYMNSGDGSAVGTLVEEADTQYQQLDSNSLNALYKVDDSVSNKNTDNVDINYQQVDKFEQGRNKRNAEDIEHAVFPIGARILDTQVDTVTVPVETGIETVETATEDIEVDLSMSEGMDIGVNAGVKKTTSNNATVEIVTTSSSSSNSGRLPGKSSLLLQNQVQVLKHSIDGLVERVKDLEDWKAEQRKLGSSSQQDVFWESGLIPHNRLSSTCLHMHNRGAKYTEVANILRSPQFSGRNVTVWLLEKLHEAKETLNKSFHWCPGWAESTSDKNQCVLLHKPEVGMMCLRKDSCDMLHNFLCINH